MYLSIITKHHPLTFVCRPKSQSVGMRPIIRHTSEKSHGYITYGPTQSLNFIEE